MGFHFVLTRNRSDLIDMVFGWLWKLEGSNDHTDVRAVLSGIEKALKTGIAMAPCSSNVMAAEDSSMSTIATR